MSYDLSFWKPQTGFVLPPQQIYEHLSEGEFVQGLEVLPIKVILERVKQAFPGTDDTCGELDWQSVEGQGAFQVSWTPQYVRADCYGLRVENINTLIDIAYEFSCVFYDPQVEQLYGQVPQEALEAPRRIAPD